MQHKKPVYAILRTTIDNAKETHWTMWVNLSRSILPYITVICHWCLHNNKLHTWLYHVKTRHAMSTNSTWQIFNHQQRRCHTHLPLHPWFWLKVVLKELALVSPDSFPLYHNILEVVTVDHPPVLYSTVRSFMATTHDLPTKGEDGVHRDLFSGQNTTYYLKTSTWCACIIGKNQKIETLRYNFWIFLNIKVFMAQKGFSWSHNYFLLCVKAVQFLFLRDGGSSFFSRKT
jgi:hypothetical protein